MVFGDLRDSSDSRKLLPGELDSSKTTSRCLEVSKSNTKVTQLCYFCVTFSRIPRLDSVILGSPLVVAVCSSGPRGARERPRVKPGGGRTARAPPDAPREPLGVQK